MSELQEKIKTTRDYLLHFYEWRYMRCPEGKDDYHARALRGEGFHAALQIFLEAFPMETPEEKMKRLMKDEQ